MFSLMVKQRAIKHNSHTKKNTIIGKGGNMFLLSKKLHLWVCLWLQGSKPLKENIKRTDQHRYHQQEIQSCPLRFWESTTRTEQRREQPGAMLRLHKFSATIVLVVILLLFTIIVNILHHLVNNAMHWRNIDYYAVTVWISLDCHAGVRVGRGEQDHEKSFKSR